MAALKQRNLLRTLAETERLGPVEVRRGGKRLISYSCNDYLNLSQHPKIKAAAKGSEHPPLEPKLVRGGSEGDAAVDRLEPQVGAAFAQGAFHPAPGPARRGWSPVITRSTPCWRKNWRR